MITSIVHIDADTARIPEICAEVTELEGVTDVYSVTGDVDIIAIVRVPRHEDLAEVISDRLSKVRGVLATRTYIAFRAYSSNDLAEAYDLGLGD